MKHHIARTATQNPAINGRTLYLTRVGMWTLDKERARKFLTRTEAENHTPADSEFRVEKIS